MSTTNDNLRAFPKRTQTDGIPMKLLFSHPKETSLKNGIESYNIQFLFMRKTSFSDVDVISWNRIQKFSFFMGTKGYFVFYPKQTTYRPPLRRERCASRPRDNPRERR